MLAKNARIYRARAACASLTKSSFICRGIGSRNRQDIGPSIEEKLALSSPHETDRHVRQITRRFFSLAGPLTALTLSRPSLNKS